MIPAEMGWWQKYLGAPVVWRGRSLVTGIDCFGLVERVLPDEFGLSVAPAPELSADEGRGLIEAARTVRDRRSDWSPVHWQEGAVCLWTLAARPVHVGICLHLPYFLHADWDACVVQVSSRDEQRWQRRLEGCYLPPVASPTAELRDQL